MPSSPLPLPTTDSLPSSTSTTTSPPDSPPTTAEAAKEAKKIVRLLLNPQRLLFPIPSRVCKLLPRSRLYLRHHPMPALKRLDFCDIRANEPTQASLHDKISALSAQMAATQAKIDAIKPQLMYVALLRGCWDVALSSSSTCHYLRFPLWTTFYPCQRLCPFQSRKEVLPVSSTRLSTIHDSFNVPSPAPIPSPSLPSNPLALPFPFPPLHHTLTPPPPSNRSPTPETTVKQHIALLHTYNEIRDVGQGLLGMVAENRGVRIRDVYAEFGVAEGD